MRECSVCGLAIDEAAPLVTIAGAEVPMCRECVRADADPPTPRLPDEDAIEDVIRQAENGIPEL